MAGSSSPLPEGGGARYTDIILQLLEIARIMLTLLFLAAAAAGAAPDGTSETAEKPKKLMCRYESDVSSRITRRKVCLTEEQRRERDAENRRTMSTVGKFNQPGNGS